MDVLQNINSLLDDQKFTVVASLVITLYAGLAAPALPNSVIHFFDTIIGKTILLFLIGFMASRNIQVALMIAVAFVITLHVANQRATEAYINYRVHPGFAVPPQVNTEGYENNEIENFILQDDAKEHFEEEVEEEDEEEEAISEVEDGKDIMGEDDGTDTDGPVVEEPFSVKPGHNLSGASSKMYAPVNFN